MTYWLQTESSTSLTGPGSQNITDSRHVQEDTQPAAATITEQRSLECVHLQQLRVKEDIVGSTLRTVADFCLEKMREDANDEHVDNSYYFAKYGKLQKERRWCGERRNEHETRLLQMDDPSVSGFFLSCIC